MQSGCDLYPGCSLQEDAQLREKQRLESSCLSVPELCAQARICVGLEKEALFSNSDKGIL